jgi:hypothetical protein
MGFSGMPVHDWTRVDAGIWHDFHSVWIGQLRNELNDGRLPEGYYALTEQHAGKYIADILTLRIHPESPSRQRSGAIALAQTPPKVRRKLSLATSAAARRKTLAIRHTSDHRLVALIEIVSPANKDRKEHVEAFVNKLADALDHSVHVLLVDLFPPGPHDRRGMHGALSERLGDEPEELPHGEPLTLATYVANGAVDAYLEHLAVGQPLLSMPLFLDPDYYIEVPLESTYAAAWRGTPLFWRSVVEGATNAPPE